MIRHGQPVKILNGRTSSPVLRRQKPAFTPFAKAKGVWLEVGDSMGHFMDVKLLSFSHHPKSILTLYPPLQMSNLVLRRQEPAFTSFTRTKGVWLEMGDNMGHFMDVKLLSFSHHPKSILTLYPPTLATTNQCPGTKI